MDPEFSVFDTRVLMCVTVGPSIFPFYFSAFASFSPKHMYDLGAENIKSRTWNSDVGEERGTRAP